MNYTQLIAEHAKIEAAMSVVLQQSAATVPCPDDVSKSLEVLASLLRDHLAGEDDALYQTMHHARRGRHADAAIRASAKFDRLKDDWTGYLYRWDGDAIRGDWASFSSATAAMMERLQDRVTFETMVLYSLALHHQVITVD